jgi:hypothetical protein
MRLGGSSAFVEGAVEFAVVALAVKLEERGGIKRGLVTTSVNGYLLTPPPQLNTLRANAADASLRQVLLVEPVEAVFGYFDFIILLAWHNPFIAEQIGVLSHHRFCC